MDEDEEWTVFWNDQSVGIERCLKMKSYQRINHFPGILEGTHIDSIINELGMNEISRKDLLSRNLTRMYKQFGKDYHIFPRTWTFPADQADFLTFLSGRKKEKIFICKPQRGCQGRGIFLSRKPHKDVKTSEGNVLGLLRLVTGNLRER
jgi:tubulin polyglutamylase TTLL6/13